MMDYFIDISNHKKVDVPSWVSSENASNRAFRVTEKLFLERTEYILTHNRRSHFKRKRSYQISGSEVASKVGIAKSTLLVTSSYSVSFKKYLKEINGRLLSMMENRLSTTEKLYSRGPIARPKATLVQEVYDYKKRIKELEGRNAVEQVEIIFSRLGLKVRQLLLMDS